MTIVASLEIVGCGSVSVFSRMPAYASMRERQLSPYLARTSVDVPIKPQLFVVIITIAVEVTASRDDVISFASPGLVGGSS